MYDENKWSGYRDEEQRDEMVRPGDSMQERPRPQEQRQDGTVNFTMHDSNSYDGAPGDDRQRQEPWDGRARAAGPAGDDSQAGSSEYDGRRQRSYEYTVNRSYIPEEPERKKKDRKPSLVRRAAQITAAGLLFGCVAGGSMVGANMLYDHFQKESYPAVSQAETLPEQSNAALTQPETVAGKQQDDGISNALVALNGDVSAIVEEAMPSVVAITNTVLYQSNTFFGSQTYKIPASGSGIIVGQNDDELLIVTNNHVVEGSTELKVTFIDNTSVDAAIKGTDSDSDLAVVAVPLKDIPAETLAQIKAATLGDSDDMKVGQGVVAIGNALGYGQSVTVGYVSALNREVDTENAKRTLLQTDAAINPGNSGGALLNMKGEVIGINAAKYSSTDVEGIGYAIPISYAKDIIDDLMTKATRVEVEEDKRGYLGIQPQNIDRAMSEAFGMPQGIYIYKIVEGSAASKSDLRERDIITKFDGQSLKNGEELQEMLTYYKAGTKVTLTVQSLENGAYVERQVDVILGARPKEVEQN